MDPKQVLKFAETQKKKITAENIYASICVCVCMFLCFFGVCVCQCVCMCMCVWTLHFFSHFYTFLPPPHSSFEHLLKRLKTTALFTSKAYFSFEIVKF